MKIYAINDTAIGFSSAFEANNDAIAERIFCGMCEEKNPNSKLFRKYPDQFTLWKICEIEYSEENGMSGEMTPKKMITAKEAIAINGEN